MLDHQSGNDYCLPYKKNILKKINNSAKGEITKSLPKEQIKIC